MPRFLEERLQSGRTGRVLVVVPAGVRQKHPPLAAMKFVSFLKRRGIPYKIQVGNKAQGWVPSHVFLSTVFSYDSAKYSECLDFYQTRFPRSQFLVGGVFASLMPEYFRKRHGLEPFVGLCDELDSEFPDLRCFDRHGLGTDRAMVHASRGCPNRCGYCCVPRVEGGYVPAGSVAGAIADAKRQKRVKGVVVFDNNFTVHPRFEGIVGEIRDSGLPVDFSQGLDCVRMTEGKMKAFAGLKFDSQSDGGTPYLRFAFDKWGQKDGLERTLTWCGEFGIRAGYFAYFMYNYEDSPAEFYAKVRHVDEVVRRVGRTVFLFPQEFEPLDALERHGHVSKGWTREQLAGLRRLYTHVHGFLPVTVSGNLFNWIGRTEKDFVGMIGRYGKGEIVTKGVKV